MALHSTINENSELLPSPKSEDTNSIDTVVELNNEPGPSKTSKKKFSIPICGKEFVKKSIGKKWRDYKCDLKVMYVTKYKTKMP
ncbi:hypothetical protein H5410_042289 [Solanum commersonii]|uniref:Uncharacterized protein n=1 Tax=Solanum commersonii TaxID=4109 RepID=A0A9J5XVZ1_SOLCO|nr:hypothetical protein H5410_042289 [Solanum commersonii]